MNSNLTQDNANQDHIMTVDGMYEDYFLDYGSYVILEREVPAVEDGIKPVEGRILDGM